MANAVAVPDRRRKDPSLFRPQGLSSIPIQQLIFGTMEPCQGQQDSYAIKKLGVCRFLQLHILFPA